MFLRFLKMIFIFYVVFFKLYMDSIQFKVS